jgi:hypothetical protein
MAEVRDVPLHTNRKYKYGVTEDNEECVYCIELTFARQFRVPPSFNPFQQTEDVCILHFNLSPHHSVSQAITSRQQTNQVALPSTYDWTRRN